MTGVDEDCRTLEMYFDDLHRVKELVKSVELVVSERVVTLDLFSSAAETKSAEFKQTRLQPCKVKNTVYVIILQQQRSILLYFIIKYHLKEQK